MEPKVKNIDLLPENKLLNMVLLLKMTFTVVGLIPFIFFPKSLIISIGIPCNDTTMFIRSLGFLYIALFFVYSTGLFRQRKTVIQLM